MKVLHIISNLNIGGAERTLLRLIESLPQIEHRIISLSDEGSLGIYLVNNGYKVVALKLKFKNIHLSYKILKNEMLDYKPDIVQTWMYHSDLIGGLFARAFGIKNVLWNIRSTRIPQGVFSITNIIVKINAILSHFIPKFIICCAENSKLYHLSLGYSKKRIKVIENGFDPIYFDPTLFNKDATRIKYGLPLYTNVVGAVGRYDRLKGFDIFIKAASIIGNRQKNIIFLIVGRGISKDNMELLNTIKLYGGGAKFILVDEVEDIRPLYRCMDIYCMSSRSEGFPNSLAEAMLMKIPCVATDVGDANRILGSCGIIVESENHIILADAILKMLNFDSYEYGRLSDESREKIKNKYDLKNLSDKYYQLYLNIFR